jgi:hypothetical protein
MSGERNHMTAPGSSAHVTDSDIERFRGRELPAGALVVFADHLGTCGQCRARLATSHDLASAERAFDSAIGVSDSHVPEDDVHAYVDGRLDAMRRRRIDAHLERCASCAEEMRDLQRFAADGHAVHGRRGTWWYIGLAAAAVLLLAATLPRIFHATPPPALMVLNDGAATISVDARGNISPLAGLESGDATRIQRALVSGRLAVPPAVAALAGTEGQLRGDTSEMRFHVVTPLATAVLSDRPTLRWTALSDDATYVVTLRDDTSGVTIDSPPVTTVEWTPDVPLTRGDTYVWQVEASLQGQHSTTPKPPSPPAMFVVLDAAAAARLARAPASHLARGILYADAGALDDAAREFSALRRQNASWETVDRFVSQMAQARSPQPSRDGR